MTPIIAGWDVTFISSAARAETHLGWAASRQASKHPMFTWWMTYLRVLVAPP